MLPLESPKLLNIQPWHLTVLGISYIRRLIIIITQNPQLNPPEYANQCHNNSFCDLPKNHPIDLLWNIMSFCHSSVETKTRMDTITCNLNTDK